VAGDSPKTGERGKVESRKSRGEASSAEDLVRCCSGESVGECFEPELGWYWLLPPSEISRPNPRLRLFLLPCSLARFETPPFRSFSSICGRVALTLLLGEDEAEENWTVGTEEDVDVAEDWRSIVWVGREAAKGREGMEPLEEVGREMLGRLLEEQDFKDL
jgi:hypothetical protein